MWILFLCVSTHSPTLSAISIIALSSSWWSSSIARPLISDLVKFDALAVFTHFTSIPSFNDSSACLFVEFDLFHDGRSPILSLLTVKNEFLTMSKDTFQFCITDNDVSNLYDQGWGEDWGTLCRDPTIA